MIKQKVLLFVGFFLVALFIIVYLLFYIETFEGLSNTSYYVIHMTKNNERLENIYKQQEQLNSSIEIFNAIVGKDIPNPKDLSKYDERLVNLNESPGEVGCYLSHFMLMKHIMETSNTKYSVIFEDDFYIPPPTTNNDIEKIIQTLDDDKRNFDMIFLGTCCGYTGEEYKNNIREIKNLNQDAVVMCAHGYIVNNASINKICNLILNIDEAIDQKYNNIIKSGDIKAYLIVPHIVNQYSGDGKMKSTIR
jgi:GR25 family glycosyltransferase involved in LPS biosynthesis